MTERGKRPGAGATLERTLREGLPPGVEFDEREEVLLAAAAQQADDIAALEADIRDRGHVVRGARGGDVVNPSVREVRQGRLALGRLLGAIDLPGGASATVLRAEKAARVRWKEAS